MSEWPPRNVVCVGVVVVDDGRILLVRQAPGTSLAGQWSVPWGLVESGEFPDEAAVRETREEAGVTVRIEGLLGLQNLEWQSAIGVVFWGTAVSGKPTPDGVETDAAAWLSLDQLDNLAEPIEPWTEWLARRVLRREYTVVPLAMKNPFRPYKAFL